MNGTNILIDTNIALYLLKGDSTVASILNNQNVYISEITELELLGFSNIKENEITIIEDFIEDCIVVPLNNKIKRLTVEIKRSYKIKLPDAIIAATANYLKMPLFTADKGFSKIEGLNLLQYEVNDK